MADALGPGGLTEPQQSSSGPNRTELSLMWVVNGVFQKPFDMVSFIRIVSQWLIGFLFLIIHRNTNIYYLPETLTDLTPATASTENMGWKKF